jgi:hypothetical protein
MNLILAKAFPPDLVSCHESAGERLVSPRELEPSNSFTVTVSHGQMEIPYRIYAEPLSTQEVDGLPEELRVIAACWFSRHHDGRVRERSLRAIPAYDSEWVISYILPLLGEYVLPILEVIWDRRDRFDATALAAWIEKNPTLYKTIKRRVASYWNCYYRSEHPDFSRYVGCQLIEFFDIHHQPADAVITS